MTHNVFLRDPIKLTFWSFDKTWSSSSVIVLGDQPPEVKSAIKTGKKQVLKNFFGSKFANKLGMSTKGGNALDISDLDITAIETVAEPVRKAKIEKYLYDMILFPEDKVTDLKLKISYFFGIPMFRQHIWYSYRGESVPLMYRFKQGTTGLPVDMAEIVTNAERKNGEQILGVPVSMWLHKNKDTLKIEADDNFVLLDELYHKYGVTEYNIVDLESFINPIRTELSKLDDKYQISVLYYSFVLKYFPQMNYAAWEEYIENKDLSASYPYLDPPKEDLSYIPLQQSLAAEMYRNLSTAETKAIDDILFKSLTAATLKVPSIHRSKVVNIRLLFDLLQTGTELGIEAINLLDTHDSRQIRLDKYHISSLSSRVEDKLLPGVLYIKVVFDTKVQDMIIKRSLKLNVFPNAAYSVTGVWGEELGYQFSDINQIVDKHITPIVRKINSLGVMYQSANLPIMSKSNVKYIDISLSLFWKQILSSNEFAIVKEQLNNFTTSKIIQVKPTTDATKFGLTYYFKRGMFEFDPKRIEKLSNISNYYEYLFNSDTRQKWYMLFENIRVMTVTHRFSDVKINISGIKEDEYMIFTKYIILLISLCKKKISTGVVSKAAEIRKVKALANLKEQDPQLYNLKKIHGTETVYSKLCQKPYQPTILTKEQYDALDTRARENTVKYWNFTTQSPAYYRCPNPKFPHVRFITGKHPLGYCIPCCKIKAPPTDVKDRQRIVYESCVNTGKYFKKSIEQSGSRYIMSYGKPVDIGRLSFLPEDTLEPLFYDTKPSEDIGSDTLVEAKYYLFGVPQDHPSGVSKVGYLYCISHSLGLSSEDFVKEAITKIKATPELYSMLISGTLIARTDWQSVDLLVENLATEFLGGKFKLAFDQWNELFIDIARLYFNVHTVIFEDVDTVIKLAVPSYMRSYIDYKYENHKHLIVLHNHQSDYWNPIYVVHKDVYFRTGVIDRRLFDYQSDIIQLIIDMVRNKFKVGGQSTQLTLDILRAFMIEKGYKVNKLCLTKGDLCYGVIIDKLGYIPVNLSYTKYDPEWTPVTFSPEDIIPVKISTLLEFSKTWNNWVAKKSAEAGFIKVDIPASKPLIERIEPMYPLIEVSKWLLYKNTIIGFIAVDMYWYITPESMKKCTKLVDAPVLVLNYNPFEINKLLKGYPNIESIPDTRTDLLNVSLYKRYLYQILLQLFTKIFTAQKNTKLRLELTKLFAKADLRKVEQLDKQIRSMIARSTNVNETHESVIEDTLKIKSLITEISDKKELLKVFESETYQFDQVILDRMQKMPIDSVKTQLHKLIADHVKETSDIKIPTNVQFPNVLTDCSTTQVYCSDDKLLIPKKKLQEYVEIIASQIKNPFISKYLFNPILNSVIVNYYKFKSNPGEIVEIEL